MYSLFVNLCRLISVSIKVYSVLQLYHKGEGSPLCFLRNHTQVYWKRDIRRMFVKPSVSDLGFFISVLIILYSRMWLFGSTPCTCCMIKETCQQDPWIQCRADRSGNCEPEWAPMTYRLKCLSFKSLLKYSPCMNHCFMESGHFEH